MVEIKDIWIKSPGVAPFSAKAASNQQVMVGVKIDGKNAFTFDEYIDAVRSYGLGIGAGLSTLMIVVAGYKYLTSQGNSSATNEAKEIIISTLLGLAMLIILDQILGLFK